MHSLDFFTTISSGGLDNRVLKVWYYRQSKFSKENTRRKDSPKSMKNDVHGKTQKNIENEESRKMASPSEESKKN